MSGPLSVSPGDGSGALAPGTRNDITSGVAALGVPERDIEVEMRAGGSLSYVRVHVSIEKFRAVSTKIVDAVKGVVGSGEQAGVIFTSSKCDDLVGAARTKAVADASKRVARLASAAKVHAGSIVGLEEPSVTSFLPTQLDVCNPDFSSLEAGDSIGISLLTAGGSTGGASLKPLDSEARVSEHVSVSETRAVTG